ASSLCRSTKLFVDNYEQVRMMCFRSAVPLMKKNELRKPTEAEMAILRVLWRRGASTVREVWEQISPRQQTGYTTVLKIMQTMAATGLVKRNESARSHVYETAMSEEQTQRQVVRHLLDRVFA